MNTGDSRQKTELKEKNKTNHESMKFGKHEKGHSLL
jgi:hypothetical protein